jgi:hypothetical protein
MSDYETSAEPWDGPAVPDELYGHQIERCPKCGEPLQAEREHGCFRCGWEPACR